MLSFTQTLTDVTVTVPITLKKAKVVFKPNHLSIETQGFSKQGPLSFVVRPDDCTWLIDDLTLVLHLEKSKQEWIKCVFVGDPEIDTTKIEPENSKLSDLDQQTRMTVEKMMFDQQQKQRGLPTSEQSKQAQMMEQFKKAHPEMDFSQLKQ